MKHRAFTLTELVVMIAVVVVAIMLLLAPFNLGSRRASRYMANTGQLRGIHTGMVIYAQGNGGYFPGLNSAGDPVDLTVESRNRILLEHGYFSGEYAIAPGDRKQPWTGGPVHSGQYSYAMLSVTDLGERRHEWVDAPNGLAVAVADRLRHTASGNLASIHTTPADGQDDWRGSVGWNDGHVTFAQTHIMATRYGDVDNVDDNIFEATGADDAYMIYRGE